MSKLNASKIRERLRQVPTLKIIFLKELKSLLKTDRFFVMILSFSFSFTYIEDCTIYKGGIYEINLQFIFMDKTSPPGSYLRVPPKGPGSQVPP